VWSASGYVGAFSRAMNRIYEVAEGRPVWKLRPIQLLLTLVGLTLAAQLLGECHRSTGAPPIMPPQHRTYATGIQGSARHRGDFGVPSEQDVWAPAARGTAAIDAFVEPHRR
jgi:hypothetical protein